MVDETKELAVSPLARLLSGYAGDAAARHRLLWAYDARLADIVRTTREPMIGRMRLTWWHEVLSDAAGVKGRGDPLVDALRAMPPAENPGAGMLRMIDGWEALLDQPLDDAALRAYADGRGGGLFAALAGDVQDDGWLEREGALWALWDLSGHSGDTLLTERAIGMARGDAGERPQFPKSWSKSWPKSWTPLRIAAGLARQDIAAGRPAPADMTPGLYARLLRVAVIGR